MTRTTNARVAGAAFLAYIALGIGAMVLSGRAGHGDGIAAQLASLAAHASDVRLAAVLNLFSAFMALVLAVTLYAITRDEDPDLAMLGLTFRVAEGIAGGIAIQRSLGLLWLGTGLAPVSGSPALDTAAAQAIGAFLTGQRWSPVIGGTFFAVGSTLFSWLLLRGRMIPLVLAWLGLVASLLLVVALPLQLLGFLHGSITQLIWLPAAAFEIPLAVWFLVKGVAVPARRGRERQP